MTEHIEQPYWSARHHRKEPRPRVLFGDHCVFFSTTGARTAFEPESMWNDGFTGLNETFFIAGPQDLRPENHNNLKAALAQAVEHARDRDMSAIELKNKQLHFFGSVAHALADKHPEVLVKHFAKRSSAIREAFATPRAWRDYQENPVGSYDLLDAISDHLGAEVQSKEMYQYVRSLYVRKGYGELVEKTELEVARNNLKFSLNLRERFEDQTFREHAAERAVKAKPSDKGTRVSISKSQMRAMRRELIDQHYADLDAVINDARAQMVELSQRKNAASPFEYSKEERQTMLEIHDMAQRPVLGKPLIQAGYRNPNLTILLENRALGGFSGVSYEGQDIIRMTLKPKHESVYSVLAEELMHQGIHNIYRNDSLPYLNDEDPRKQLLVDAIAQDSKKSKPLQVLGLVPLANYNPNNTASMHKEAPVKAIKYLADPDMASTVNQHCKALAEFAHKVVLGDAVSYLLGKPLPEITGNYERILQRKLPRQESPYSDQQRT